MGYPDEAVRGMPVDRRHNDMRSAPRDERRRSPDRHGRYEVDSRYRYRDRGERDSHRRDREQHERRPKDRDRHADRHEDSRSAPSQGGRHNSALGRLPARPKKQDIDNDPSIQASSLTEYRQLKRKKMADRCEWLIWERSPPPMDEPLLLEQEEEPEQAPAGAADADGPLKSPQEEALDREELQLFCDWLQERKSRQKEEMEKRRVEEEENRPVGPTLPQTTEASAQGDYGINLRPGEGERMAAFAKQGQRIPRRGEVGLTSDQIESYEEIGYVMSGNRHSRMNAVRIRKENQIYTAEEKAALAMFNAEEAQRKEAKLVEEMKKLVEETVGKQAADAGQDD